MLGLLKTSPWLRPHGEPAQGGRSTALPRRLSVLLTPLPGRVSQAVRLVEPCNGPGPATGGCHG